MYMLFKKNRVEFARFIYRTSKSIMLKKEIDQSHSCCLCMGFLNYGTHGDIK
jgi:hypothetical protein